MREEVNKEEDGRSTMNKRKDTVALIVSGSMLFCQEKTDRCLNNAVEKD